MPDEREGPDWASLDVAAVPVIHLDPNAPEVQGEIVKELVAGKSVGLTRVDGEQVVI